MDKRYYWIKLKTNFFNIDEIDFLLSQKNGCEYVVLYQMLCLNTANTNGTLESRIGEMIVPYNIDKIVRDTKYFDYDTVVVALELYKKLGLIYENNNKCLTISNFEDMVGSETSSAKRVREWRKNQEQKLLQCNTDVTSNVTQEYRDKSIEYRDKIIEKEKDNILTEVRDTHTLKSPESLISEEFEEIWSIYPNKKGKSKAYAKYKKYRTSKKDDYCTKEEVLKGIENYIRYIEENNIEPQFIKHGDTYFNNRSWLDIYSVQENNDDLELFYTSKKDDIDVNVENFDFDEWIEKLD